MNILASAANPPLSKITLLAITEALEARFDAAAWIKLGIELDLSQLADPELDFHRALRHGDDDYGYQVAQFVSFLESENPTALRSLAGRSELRTWLLQHAPDAAHELGLGQCTAPSQPQPPRSSAGEVAGGTLREVAHAPNTPCAASALDAAHAALHLDLRAACAKAGLAVPENASTGMLFNAIRSAHPALVAIAQHAPQVDVMLASLALVVTAISALRDPLAAQPDHIPLGGPEAALMTELMRALSGYLQAQLKVSGSLIG